MNSQALKRQIALSALILLIAIGVFYGISRRRSNAAMRERNRVAGRLEEVGVIAKDDYLKLKHIQDGIEVNGKVSDSDLDWMIASMNRTIDAKNAYLVHSDYLATMAFLKEVTPSQKDKILRVTIAMLDSTDSDDKPYKLNQRFALNVQRAIKDERAIPHILPWLDDPDSKLREKAQATLAEMGYKK